MKITSIALRRPVATLALMATALVLGFYGYLNLPTDFLPDITYPMVRVHIYWKGATPEEINDNIAEPVERILSTVDNLDYLESSCIEGQYTLRVNFEYGANIDVFLSGCRGQDGLGQAAASARR